MCPRQHVKRRPDLRMLRKLGEGHGIVAGDLGGGHGGESRHRGGEEGNGGEELHGIQLAVDKIVNNYGRKMPMRGSKSYDV